MYIKNSFSGKNWKLAEFDKRKSLLISQRYELSEITSQLIAIRDINIEVNGFYFMNYLAYWSLRLGGWVAWNGHRKRNSKIK